MAALSHGDRKAMAELKYPASFNQKVDVGKVKTDVIAKFVAHRRRYRPQGQLTSSRHIEDTLSSLLPPDDDITVQAFINEINAAEGVRFSPCFALSRAHKLLDEPGPEATPALPYRVYW